jgi:hypothetical protein
MLNSKNTPEITATQTFSFKKGYNQVKRRDLPRIQQELMMILHIKTRNSFYQRLAGRIEPKVSEAQSIERVFEKYGITDIWGAD